MSVAHNGSSSHIRSRMVTCPLELRYVDRFCGKYPGETDMSLADVNAGKDVFERGVALLSKETITQIIVAKRAACESMRLRAMTTAWEIQASSEYSKLLERRKSENLPTTLQQFPLWKRLFHMTRRSLKLL
ncbi:hypothetical protein BDR03DRAFT_954332 [Suillus americanus]|nr:hypothetical protein BDR03DRAFT_954332 [Suillus americanus]